MLYSLVNMRIAILSDIHANLAALEAVLADAGAVDGIWCPGDIVGYGPSPNECIDILRAHDAQCVAGNHDWAAIGKLGTEWFNADAAFAANWTNQNLLPDSRTYLLGLPQVLSPLDCPEFTIVHGSLHDPLRQYLATVRDADETFALLESPYCIVGHTHVPLIFRSGQRGEPSREGASPGHRALKIHGDPMIFNPGSVGQPRDGNSQASYMLWDGTEGEISYRRVRYDVAHTERLMLLNNLPPRLSQRLFYGW